MAPIEDRYNKIGGILIWLAVSLIANILINAYQALRHFNVEADSFGNIIPLLLTYAVYIILPSFLLFYLFKRKRLFPKVMMVYIAINIFLLVLMYIFMRIPDSGANVKEINDVLRELVIYTFVGAIWITYLKMSVRVKNTFIK